MPLNLRFLLNFFYVSIFLNYFTRTNETIHPETADFNVRNYIYSFGLKRLLAIHSHLNLNSVSKSTFNTNLSDPIPRNWCKSAPRLN
jgi:hypothetical protein